jgi:hypothetical protein
LEVLSLRGLSKILVGILLIIIFLVTLFTVSIPIIWTGAGITGALFIFYGLREAMADDRQWSCKHCSFRAHTRKEVVQHVLDTHQDNLSPEALESLQAYVEGKKHKCTFCGRWITTKRELLTHALEEHEAELSPEQADEIRRSLGMVPATTNQKL